MISPWKILSVVLILYALIGGLLMPVPELPILEQSIRNLYYHVPMWFSMVLLLLASAVHAVKVLGGKGLEADAKSNIFATVGMLYGTIGIVTGMIWAKNTWGAYWVSDPKLNSAAIGMLMYSAYFVLRGSFEDEEKKARYAAIYNLFCFPVFVVLIFSLFLMGFQIFFIAFRAGRRREIERASGGGPEALVVFYKIRDLFALRVSV
jgi:heme exporter protein C